MSIFICFCELDYTLSKFVSDDFNFLIQLNKMQQLSTNANSGQTLAEAFPEGRPCDIGGLPKTDKIENGEPVTLYDVVYACIAPRTDGIRK